MLLMGLVLRGGYLCVFARFCDTFRDVFARGRRAAEGPKARTGLAFVVSHPCLKNKGTARMGHPADLEAGAFGGRDDFSDIFPHRIFPPEDYFYCALLGVNCMQGWPGFFLRF